MRQTTVIYLSLLLSLHASLSSAAQVYTWVDDAGITHFSETPPSDTATDTQLVNIQPPPAPANTPDGDFYNSTYDDTRYYPVYPYYPRYGHHPGQPGYGHKPVHPVYPRPARPRNPRTSLGKTPGMPGQSGSWR